MNLRSVTFSIAVCAGLVLNVQLVAVSASENAPELASARRARDQADIAALSRLVEEASADARRQNTAAAYQRVAQLDLWLCEAGHVHNENKLIKKAAEDGIAASAKAVSLDANSSEGHRLYGDLLGELIPHMTMGGMRYGKHAASELDKAVQLDPKNANAYVGRAIGYYFTPSAFGGSKDKAAEMLTQAIETDPQCDRAHIWLARVYLAEGKHDDALTEIQDALRIDPDRSFAKWVQQQIAAGRNK
ncbi:MAG TPA: tetratricopeptide repeat protein [Terriglobales bacterium]|nr:tetratricopeptide repeat protein [Terriglobales bacterium]